MDAPSPTGAAALSGRRAVPLRVYPLRGSRSRFLTRPMLSLGSSSSLICSAAGHMGLRKSPAYLGPAGKRRHDEERCAGDSARYRPHDRVERPLSPGPVANGSGAHAWLGTPSETRRHHLRDAAQPSHRVPRRAGESCNRSRLFMSLSRRRGRTRRRSPRMTEERACSAPIRLQSAFQRVMRPFWSTSAHRSRQSRTCVKGPPRKQRLDYAWVMDSAGTPRAIRPSSSAPPTVAA